jgi:hypothetical protein
LSIAFWSRLARIGGVVAFKSRKMTAYRPVLSSHPKVVLARSFSSSAPQDQVGAGVAVRRVRRCPTPVGLRGCDFDQAECPHAARIDQGLDALHIELGPRAPWPSRRVPLRVGIGVVALALAIDPAIAQATSRASSIVADTLSEPFLAINRQTPLDCSWCCASHDSYFLVSER